MSFTITAELPLGTYRGASADGRPEPLPSVARLHSALLCAAGFGPRAVPAGDTLAPCRADEAALRWLEEHPPDQVSVPRLEVNRGTAIAYRLDGTIKETKGTATIKKHAKAADTAVAVGGQFAWSWNDPPPPEVRDALTALCAEVPYLGTTESPVRLTVSPEPVEPTHELDPDPDLFPPPNALDIDACLPGRTAELAAAHAPQLVIPPPSRDKYRTDESSRSPVPSRESLTTLRYVQRGDVATDVPWDRVILLGLSRAVPQQYRVAWALAAHRALISLLGTEAPPLVTGNYLPDAPRPANRLALHLLDQHAPVAGGLEWPGALAIMLPQDAAATDLQLVAQAVDNLRSVRGPRGSHPVRIIGKPRAVAGARFWQPPAAGKVRLWRTIPAAVPDTRGSRTTEWTFEHAALLSVGFVWKRQLPRVSGRRDEYYRNLAGAATDAGVAVLGTRPLRTTNVGRYAHRVNAHAVVRPYTATMWLGNLAPTTTIAAIGQSRHLGGGLLMPHDVAEGTPLAETLTGGEGGDDA